MAITAPTMRSDFDSLFLTPEMSAPIFEEAARISAVQSLVGRVPLSPNGKAIPVVTGKMSAAWTDEGEEKHKSAGGIGLKTIKPEKLTAMAVVSTETARANPGGYMGLLSAQIAEAFAIAFDFATLHNLGGDGTGTGPFATHLAQVTKNVELGSGTTMHNDFVAALGLLVNDGKRLSGFALDEIVEPMILDELDANNRPLYRGVDDTNAGGSDAGPAQGRLLNRTSYMRDGIATPDGTTVVGMAGNWRQAAWGAVGGINIDFSTQATVTINGVLTSLWEKNLVAVRAEAEYGFLVNDVDSFVKLSNAV